MAGISYNTPLEGVSLAWVGDELRQRERVMVTGGFLESVDFDPVNSVRVTVGTGGAAAAATSVPVTALPGALPVGTVLDFGGAKFARLTAAAVAGATALTVAALPTALAAGDVALYAPSTRKYAESGTLVGRTYAERDANRGFGPVAIDGGGNVTDNEVYLLLHDVYNIERDKSATFYRPGSLVYDELLPAASRTINQLAAVRRFYQAQRRP